MKTIKINKRKDKFVRTYHDEDCPKCGFPETIIVRDKKTMKPLFIECSKKCGWSKKFK